MAYPVKAICEVKDVRSNGTSIIYLQYYARDGKRRLNTRVAIPPRFWNSKQQIVSGSLPLQYGSYSELNKEITRQHRLVEDLIQWAEEQGITALGDYVAKTFRPDLDLNSLMLGIHVDQFGSGKVSNLKRCCCAPPVVAQIVPFKPVLVPAEVSTFTGMIFPNLPADSPKNGRPWPNVFDQIEKYIKDKEGEVSPKTIQVYKNMGDHLRQFETFRKEPITFLSFDYAFYDQYKKFLTHDYVHTHRKEVVIGMKRNSMSKTMKQLRLFVKDRSKRQLIPPIDMSDFKAPEEETDAIYLNFSEIAQFYHCDLSTRPGLVGDQKLFVLACLTGLRFSDFSRLGLEDYRDGKLYKKTEKGNKWVVIPLRDEAKEILEYFVANGFPKTDSVKFNENIKAIGRLAGITQNITFSYQKGGETIEDTRAKCDWITSHTGRRSFCTNEFLSGTPVKLIMSISGHKKEKDFYKYIRITAEEGAQLMKKLWLERGGMQALVAPLQVAS